MINSSRLSQPVASKLEPEQNRTRLNGFDLQDSSGLPSDSLLSGGYLLNGRGGVGGRNTFDQLLQLAKAQPEKPTSTTDSVQNKDKANEKRLSQRDNDKREDSVGKKESAPSKNRRSDGDKDAEKSKQSDSAELAQLLAAQSQQVQTSQKPEQAQTSQKPEQVQTSQKPEQVQTSQKPEQVQTSQKPEHARGTDQRQSAVLTSKANDLNQSKSLTLEQPETLDDALSNLAKKVTALGEDHHKAAGDTTQDELGKIASKFDSVQMDFSGEAGNTQTALTQVQLQKSVQNREALLKMIQQEGLESDRAFNDFLKQSAAQNAMMEGHALDRVNALNQLKSAQIERLNLQDLRQDALLAQQQMKEFQAGQPSQWKTLDELSPDQIAMMDSLSGMNNGLASEKTLGFSQTLPQSVQARLTTQEQQDFKPTDATQGAVDPHALFSSLKSDGNPTSGFSQNGSSFAGQSNRNEIGQAASSSSVRVEDTDFASQDKAQQAKADARARESERTREMARNAAQRAQTIAAELAAKGGGTARVQIKDSQLGVVELRINMSDNNRMNVELVANSDRIKLELEKQAGALKDGLEKHKLVVDGVHFATDMKLGESSFQSSTQTDSQNQQQPSAQNQQGFNSFAQNSSGQGQGGFEQERFFEPQRLVNVANQRPQVNARQSYTGKNESQTNIQRNANGSLKVTA